MISALRSRRAVGQCIVTLLIAHVVYLAFLGDFMYHYVVKWMTGYLPSDTSDDLLYQVRGICSLSMLL